MDKKTIWSVVGGVVVVAAAIFAVYLYQCNGICQPGEKVPVKNANTIVDDLIRVDMPLPNVLVQSPIVVKGQARGSWYFEGSFPVKIFDANGKQLGQVPAQAKSDWQTEDFVLFEASLIFDAPTTETGTVVFQNANPSGLVQNNRSVSVPVYFSANASKL